MLSCTPGIEEVIYDIQLFSKGLLLETSKTPKPKQYRWTDIRECLNSGEIAIEFIKSGNGYCAAVIKSESQKPQIIPLFTQSEYDSLSEDMGLYLSSAGYDLILAPLALTDSISTIYFSPTGILNTVAIESFCDNSGTLVSDKWNFVRLSTTKELITEHQGREFKHIALYGGLDYNRRSPHDDNYKEILSDKKHDISSSRYIAPENLRYGVDSLRWSLPEVTTIRNLYMSKFPLSEISLFTSDAGVEESLYTLQDKQPNIIHFSTHGYYWTAEESDKRNYISLVKRANMERDNSAEQAMLFSGLFLSGANAALRGDVLPDNIEDGILTAKELSEMDFSETDFVALSACQTGLGTLNGEGVFGLQRGFKLAGVKSLLMSLWPVHDKATELLMIEFYKNMLNGDTKYSALNKAKKYIKNYSDDEYEFSDPEYWAGWILLDALD
jgi:CHAT domain-containing protein